MKTSKQERQKLCPIVAAFKQQTSTYVSVHQITEDPLRILCTSLVLLSIAACSCVLDCMLPGTGAVCIWHSVVLYIAGSDRL